MTDEELTAVYHLIRHLEKVAVLDSERRAVDAARELFSGRILEALKRRNALLREVA